MKVNSKHNKALSAVEADDLIAILKDRFEKNVGRHKNVKWADVEECLRKKNAPLWSLNQMEATDGEPDVVGFDKKTGEYLFVDCSPESPKGRRSVCYDQSALDSRKEHKPKHSAVAMAKEMGVDVLTEEQYRKLQKLGDFDLKTSSWIATPNDIREAGGALFCDKRYGHVFTYHNGAESYYAARGWRGSISI